MRTHTRMLAVAVAVCLAALTAAPVAAQVSDADDIVFPAMPSAEIPNPERMVLDNGMVVMLLEDHELPLIDARVLVRTGARWEPADQIGLAGLLGAVLRSGGTENVPSDELDDMLEDRAATIESFAGLTNAGVNMSSLRDDFPEMLRIFADVLRNPAFEQDKLDVAKNQVTAGIARQNDNPQQIVGREFTELIYGEDSPYARQATYTTIDNISRDDLLAFHEKYFHPNRMILGLVGDFDSKKASKLVKEVFGDWPKGPKVEEPEVDYRKEPAAGIYFVEKNDVTQSFVQMGHLGIQRDNPDYYAVELMNQVLGGSFAARLFSRVRSQKGLAYAVRGQVGSRWDYPGVSQLSISTKTETTAAGIDALLEEVDNMTSEPPTEEEVEKGRAGILKSFVFRADSTAKILAQQLTYEFFGYPLDWQERYRKGIEGVSVAQVREAAEKYLHPEDFAILVVGKKEGVDRPLSDFGEVQTVDITIPEPAGEEVAMTAEGEQKGRDLIAKAVEAIGGAERLDALETVRSEFQIEAQTPQGAMQMKAKATLAMPDRMRWEMVLPFGTMIQVLNGEGSFAQTPQGTQPLPEAARKDLNDTMKRFPMVLLQHRDSEGFKAVATGAGELGGKSVEMVHLELDGQSATLGIDPESGQLVGIKYRGKNFMGAPGELVQTYSDFREVGGLTLGHSLVTTFNGEPMLSSTVVSTVLDEPIEDAEFEMPAP
ncbi:MAG: hypothetical protein GY719_42770 [bacterium]|nr:hypothetical protein [bacterium]